MYCISATAKKDDMELIAVIMGAPDIKSRSADATTLLNYGFGKCRIYCDSHEDKLDDLPVKKGLADSVGIIYQRPFQYMTTDGSDLTGITKSIELPENVTAPVKKRKHCREGGLFSKWNADRQCQYCICGYSRCCRL